MKRRILYDKIIRYFEYCFFDNEEEYNLLIDEYYEIMNGVEEQDK